MGGFSINSVTISGNLTRDPELRTLPSGTSVADLRIAHNERFKNSKTNEWEDRPNYFSVSVWGGVGEWCAKNLSKGDQITVQGRLRWRSWEKDGQKREAVDIAADGIVTPPTDGGGGRANRREEQATDDGFRAAPAGTTDVPVPAGEFAAAPAASADQDDDIPF